MKLNRPHALLVAVILAVTGSWLPGFVPPLPEHPPSSHEHLRSRGQPPPPDEIALTGDVDGEAHRLAALVLDAAIEHGVSVQRADFEVRYVDRLEEGTFLAGKTDGRVIVIGRNVAEPDRVLLHELAHGVVGIHHGHDEPWRSVYVTAVCEAFGEARARRELRRIEWVYDKSYLDDANGRHRTTGDGSDEADDPPCPTGQGVDPSSDSPAASPEMSDRSVVCCRRVRRQDDLEAATAARLARDLDRAAMQRHDRSRDRRTEPGAGPPFGAPGAETGERFEEPRHHVVIDADALIVDAHPYRGVIT